MMFEDFKEACVLFEKVRVPDGEGGWGGVEWKEGLRFNASITCDQSMQARAAEKQGVTSVYTVTTDRNASLEYHDVFKRLRDGKIFRVTSDGDDVQTPGAATFQFSQVTAEEWELPA